MGIIKKIIEEVKKENTLYHAWYSTNPRGWTTCFVFLMNCFLVDPSFSVGNARLIQSVY